VLVNSHTAGTAEELAARLKASGALIIGEPTAGRGVVFAEDKLSSGQILFAESAQPPAEHASVQPDIALPADDWSEQAALAQVAANHVGDVVQESPRRHRMSEAALVQGQDPEWDAYLEAMKKKPDAHFLLSLPPIHDAALITAMDSLKAIRITQVPAPVTAKPEAPTPPASLQ
jgi:C-terminal processing protease CtpA/Prc